MMNIVEISLFLNYFYSSMVVKNILKFKKKLNKKINKKNLMKNFLQSTSNKSKSSN